MQKPGPIYTMELFAPTREALLGLLDSLTPEEWHATTVVSGWTVKDIAGHLLKGELGILARRRDGYAMPGLSIQSWDDLVAFINTLNRTWIEAARMLSPRMICDLLRWAAPQAEEYFASLDPDATGVPVDWVSPGPAPNWLDLAREYTERWHHQQQIREAVGKPGLKEARYLAPVLDAFVRALPRTFSSVKGRLGKQVKLTIAGEAGGTWCLLREESSEWRLYLGAGDSPTTEVTMDQDDAWRLFTKGLKPEEARQRAQITGDSALAAKLFDTISIIA
jgi:uncharacterized protein (TIGR03083 family)